MADHGRVVPPPAHLAIRAFASSEGPGIAAAWLDDAFLAPHILVVAVRNRGRSWLIPQRALWSERLAVALSDVLSAAVTAPASMALLPMPDQTVEAAVQLHPVTLPMDPLDDAPVPSEWTVYVVDHTRPNVAALRNTLRSFVARLRGEAPPEPVPEDGARWPADIAMSVAGVVVAAELTQRLAAEPESAVVADRLLALAGRRDADSRDSALV